MRKSHLFSTDKTNCGASCVEQKEKILIVDDTIDTVELLTKRLRADGYDTDTAYDGEEALEKVKEYAPDLVILDVMMPKIDGYEVCRRLSRFPDRRNFRILMLTAKSEIQDKIRGLDTGADSYLGKPFDYKELKAMVKSLLSRKEAAKQETQNEKRAALDHMVDEVSHEVRNPLVTIGGFARRVRQSMQEDDPNRKYLDIILQNVESLEKMVLQLIALKDTTLSEAQPTDINKIIQEEVDRYREEIKKNTIQLTTQFAENLPLITAVRENLVTAVANIIENSIEAMQDCRQKELQISTRLVDDQVQVEITDSGRGIPRETIKNIFDPFYTSKTRGPGLGLTFALKTIQHHKGTITARSKVDEGTSFILRLPLKGVKQHAAG